ncbi:MULTISPECIES: Cof-type HAD-IIB family hydrolase [unclassified Granulicatella]|uniref:Cof-type HAD-IIB family hydrolase n=1 Tax=unclassified Granulicatella TaxID=2630493 RepID=UPI001074357B|nr:MULTISPECIES: Cof-type HAD-IIB family hydrolase [unclassified Granulicatella]MBF0780462.1 HAD family phosphatase [Granulicatella sp. 19428wC4_WM01]TFU95364.1 HAD family phosphatase [Granulicatella sp. WM01]
MIKLIAIDMDGTLLNSQHKISQKNIDVLNTVVNKNIDLVLCTGRALFGVKPYLEQLPLKDDDFIIVNNGCSIHRGSQLELVDWVQLTKQNILYLQQLVHDFPIQLVVNDDYTMYVIDEEPNDWVKKDAKLVFTHPSLLPLYKAISGEYMLFQSMLMGNPKDLDEFEACYRKILEEQFSVVRSQTYILEVMPKGTTKASALARLSRLLNISSSDMMAFGDGNNDVEMLAYVGTGVAMANGTNLVKQTAKYHTDSNDNDGVAKAIELFVLNEKE